MTIKEMHIEFDIVLDEIMSKQVQVVLPEQKDWLLNQSQLIFIENKTNPKSNVKQDGFMDTQKRYDDLESISVPSLNLTAYNKNNHRVAYQLPYDYLHLISDSSKVYHKCGNSMISELNTISTSEHITKIPLENDLYTWQNLEISYTPQGGGSTTFWTASDYWFYATGLNDNTEKFYLVDILLQEINAITGYEIYWEWYRGQFYNNCFILVNTTQGIYTVSTSDGVGTENDVYASVENILTQIDTTLFSTSVKNQISENRLVKRQDLKRILKFTYSKTSYKSPVSDLAQYQIYINTDDTFEALELEIDYIRKPRLMNITQGINCELPNYTHKEIVDIAARRYKALKSGDYQQHAVESIVIE